jgi:hypothetical protein
MYPFDLKLCKSFSDAVATTKFRIYENYFTILGCDYINAVEIVDRKKDFLSQIRAKRQQHEFYKLRVNWEGIVLVIKPNTIEDRIILNKYDCHFGLLRCKDLTINIFDEEFNDFEKIFCNIPGQHGKSKLASFSFF